MNKILLIIQREYLSRVRKKSFLLMTLLVPLLLIGMYALVYSLSKQGNDTITPVYVLDESGFFAEKLRDGETIDFSILHTSLEQAKTLVQQDKNTFLLYIPKKTSGSIKPELLSKKKAGLSLQGTIESRMNDILKAEMLLEAGINPETLASIKPDIRLSTKELTEEGEKDSSTGLAYGIGIAAAILIYMSLFIYGAQVMRGVIEEKTSRIIEVVISSVKPFQLMMGKIIGIGLVGLTQFLLWIVLSAGLMAFSSHVMMKDNTGVKIEKSTEDKQTESVQPSSDRTEVLKVLKDIPAGYFIGMYLIYFIGGYMLYSALFAAVGSAVDNETETQQFMFPITLPLLFTYIMSFSFIINNPDSSLSIWLSLIPFTSPVGMMVRLPFGVPGWQLGLSIALLIGGFILTTWIAARIYRVGILMYGKKTSFKELAKWFRYKD